MAAYNTNKAQKDLNSSAIPHFGLTYNIQPDLQNQNNLKIEDKKSDNQLDHIEQNNMMNMNHFDASFNQNNAANFET